jgi:hypothetical protein
MTKKRDGRTNQDKRTDMRPVVFDNDNPLALIAGETTKAHQALFDYAQMGLGRSLHKLIATYKKQEAEWIKFTADPKRWPKDEPIPAPIPSKGWTTISGWSGQYFWQERVIRFDEIERELDAKEFQTERAKWNRRRKELVGAFFNKTVQALAGLNMSKQELRDVTNAVKTSLDELRTEFGDDTGQAPAGRIKLVEVILAEDGSNGIDVKVHRDRPAQDEDDDE